MTPAAIKSWRTRLGFTQATAAEALGVPYSTYRDWEQGVSRPPQGILALACAAVNKKLRPVPSK